MCMRGAILVTDAKNADVSVLQGRFLYTFPIEYNLKRLKVIVSRAHSIVKKCALNCDLICQPFFKNLRFFLPKDRSHFVTKYERPLIPLTKATDTKVLE